MDQGTEINESEFSLRLGLKEERGIPEKEERKDKMGVDLVAFLSKTSRVNVNK